MTKGKTWLCQEEEEEEQQQQQQQQQQQEEKRLLGVLRRRTQKGISRLKNKKALSFQCTKFDVHCRCTLNICNNMAHVERKQIDMSAIEGLPIVWVMGELKW